MVLWGSGEISPENFLELNCLKRQKMPLQKIGEMERVQHEGEFLPLLPPSIGVPVSKYLGGGCLMI